MLLDKTLLLKGVAGVAAVGGVVGGGIAAQKGGLFSLSSKNADAAKPEAVEGGNGQQDQTPIVDNKGIPSTCTADSSTSCSLTLEDLKKIKFKELDNGVADSVEPTSDSITLTLTITTTDGNKKYTFNNSSNSSITLKKGEGKTVTLNASGTTEFTEEGEALKKVEGVSQSPQQAQTSDVDAQGIPNKCTSNPTNCELTEEDLKKIKFQVLEEETSGEVSVKNYPTQDGQKITLTIDSTDASNKRYIFNNPSSQAVTIEKGSGNSPKTVTLAAGKKTKFTVSDSKLKERELNDYGLPKEGCTNSCTLTSTDLEDVKFEALDGGTGTVTPSGKTVTLTIETSGSKTYKFKNTDTSPIVIKKEESKTVTLTANTETSFSEGENVLKLIEPTEANGVPSRCKNAGSESPCTLKEEELKNIKFKVLEEVSEGTVTLDPSSSNPSITLSIGTSSPKIYTFKNSGSKLTLKKGSSSSEKTVVLDIGDTEFTEDGDKLVIYEDPDLKKVNEKILNTLKLPSKCKFENNEKSSLTKECEVSVDELKTVEFENKNGNNPLTISGTSEKIKLGIRRLKKADDSSEYGSTINDGDIRVIFKDTESKITISGSGNDIIIPKKSNKELSIGASTQKLGNPYPQLNSLPNTWKVFCSDGTNDCSSSESDNSIKIFSGQDLGTCTKVTTSGGTNSNIFDIAKDTDEYNLGYKFTVKSGVSGSGGTITLSSGNSYEIKYSKTQKKWGFVKKSQ